MKKIRERFECDCMLPNKELVVKFGTVVTKKVRPRSQMSYK